MEKVLRECYSEDGIRGVNATIFRKRSSSISRIIDKEILDAKEWVTLTEWILGIENQDVEDVLIKLEDIFCEDDEAFSKECEKELRILSAVLIGKHCETDNADELTLRILCICHIDGIKICGHVYQSLLKHIHDRRREIRHVENEAAENYSMDVSRQKKAINARKKKDKEEETEFEYTVKDIDKIYDLLEKCELNIINFMNRERYLENELKAQREESNLAWWILNGWSENYNDSFSKLKPGEAVLAVAVESWKLIEFDIGPCSIRQIIYKGISFLKNQPENISLEDVVQAVNDKIYDSIEMNRLSIGRTQPILMALKCAYECKDSSSGDAWKIIFENQCGRKTDSIRMNVKKFAYQLYLELELACLEE